MAFKLHTHTPPPQSSAVLEVPHFSRMRTLKTSLPTCLNITPKSVPKEGRDTQTAPPLFYLFIFWEERGATAYRTCALTPPFRCVCSPSCCRHCRLVSSRLVPSRHAPYVLVVANQRGPFQKEAEEGGGRRSEPKTKGKEEGHGRGGGGSFSLYDWLLLSPIEKEKADTGGRGMKAQNSPGGKCRTGMGGVW